MNDTLLASALTAVARRIGDGIPAAYDLEASDVAIGGGTADHAMPPNATAVRWAVNTDDGFLVIALTADAADMLRAGPPEVSLVDALTELVIAVSGDLAPLFDDVPPMLDAGEEIAVDQSLADGPGDVVSISLFDEGVHRLTVGLRLVVSDALLGPAPAPLPDSLDAVADGAADPGPHPEPNPPVGLDGPVNEQAVSPGVPSLVGSGGGPDRRTLRSPAPVPVGDAHPADFASFDQLSSLPGTNHSMALLGDVEMGVTAELGRTELTVREVLGLTPGAIIELDRAAGSPVDVVVNGTLIARGEVVVIDEEFGIRITEILGMNHQVNPFPVAQ